MKTIVSEETHSEIRIDIFREKQYPIRGIADDNLLAIALEVIPDGEWFSILALGDGPFAPCRVVGFGENHHELREDFTRLSGRSVLFERHPFDKVVNYFELPNDVWSAVYYRYPQPQVSKNRTSYAPLETEPERYRPHIAFW